VIGSVHGDMKQDQVLRIGAVRARDLIHDLDSSFILLSVRRCHSRLVIKPILLRRIGTFFRTVQQVIDC
jgi:hypothetical protein